MVMKERLKPIFFCKGATDKYKVIDKNMNIAPVQPPC